MLNQRACAGVRGPGFDGGQCSSSTTWSLNALRRAGSQVGGPNFDLNCRPSRCRGAVVLLDFDTLPEKPKEAEGVIRFRLRKSLPFDVDKAAVSYHAQVTGAGLRVIAAVCLNSVMQDY